MAETGKTCEVHGRVTGKHGREVSGVKVIVWWQHIRVRRVLVVGETNGHGYYRLRYPVPEHFPGKVLIVVGASSEELEQPLESEPLEAQPELRVDLARGGKIYLLSAG